MRVSTLVIVLALGCLCSPRLSAQGFRVAQEPLWISYQSGRPALNSWHDGVSARTWWLEGGVIGMVAGGLVSYLGYELVASGVCTGSDSGGCNEHETTVTIGGAAVGFVVGALIGRGKHKAD